MTEIEIYYRPKIFYDPENPEYCEGNDECRFLNTGCCILFDEPPIMKPGEYYRKHDQCKAWCKDATNVRNIKRQRNEQ